MKYKAKNPCWNFLVIRHFVDSVSVLVREMFRSCLTKLFVSVVRYFPYIPGNPRLSSYMFPSWLSAFRYAVQCSIRVSYKN
jgi:hypothetical protein